MVKKTKKGAGLMPAAVAEIRLLKAEWAALKHSDLLTSPNKENANIDKDINKENKEKRVLKPLDYNRTVPVKKTKSSKTKQAMSLSKPIHSNVLTGVVAVVEVGSEQRALALRAALSALGASVFPHWSALVTHVVWGEGGSPTIRANARTYAAKLVSPLWVEACVTAKACLPERAFPTAARDSDLPSPRSLLCLLREAEYRKVPVQFLLQGLTAGDGASSENGARPREPGAGGAAAITAGPLPSSSGHHKRATGSSEYHERATGNPEYLKGATGSSEYLKGATGSSEYLKGATGSSEYLKGATGSPGYHRRSTSGPKMAARSTSDRNCAECPARRKSNSHGYTPMDEKDTRTDEKKIAHERRGHDAYNDARAEAVSSVRISTQGPHVAQRSDTRDAGQSYVTAGTSHEGINDQAGHNDPKHEYQAKQAQRTVRKADVLQNNENVPYDPADRLGAKPKIRPPPKEKKGKKKKSSVKAAPNNPQIVSDYTSDEVFNVNTLPRRALPISLSPTPPITPRPRPPTRRSSPPEDRSPTPPLHGHRRAWAQFLPIGTGDHIQYTITSADDPCRTPTPPLHGHRRCGIVMPQPRRRSPKDRYKSPSPGPSRAPHVPPRLRHEVSPEPSSYTRDRSPETWYMRDRSETIDSDRTPRPSRSRSNQRNRSPKTYSRKKSGDRNRSKSRNKSPGTGRSRSRGRYVPVSRTRPVSRSSDSSQSPSSTTVETETEEHETSFGGTQEDIGSRAPFPIPPRSPFVRRSRSNSAPKVQNYDYTKPKPKGKRKGCNKRMLFVQRLFAEGQNDDPERECDPESETSDRITWRKYSSQRNRPDERNVPIRKLVSTGLRQLKEHNQRMALIAAMERTLMRIASSSGSDSDMEDEPELGMRAIPGSVRQHDALDSPRHERRALARAERSAKRFADKPEEGPEDGFNEMALVLAGTPELTRPASPILFALRPRIVLTGMGVEERRSITEACILLGGRIQTRVNRNTSHVLIGSFGTNGNENRISTVTPVPGTDNRLVTIDFSLPHPVTTRLRTFNALSGAVRGCRVLRAQWALDSLAADDWIPYYHYQIPHLKALAERAAAERHAFGLSRADYAFDVFNGRRVIVAMDCEQREAVIELLALCGAVLSDDEGHMMRNEETSDRLNVNRSIHIGHDDEQVLRPIPPHEGRNEDGGWAGSNLEHSSDVTLGSQPGQVSPRWVFDSVAIGRMRSLRQYTIPRNG